MDRQYSGGARQALVKGLVAIAIVLSIPMAHRKMCDMGARREASLVEIKRLMDLDGDVENMNQREKMRFYGEIGEVVDPDSFGIPCHKKRHEYLESIGGSYINGEYVFSP